jgi:hypothetical protein
VLSAARQHKTPPAGPVQAPVTDAEERVEGQHHHWHLSDLLHPFRKAG